MGLIHNQTAIAVYSIAIVIYVIWLVRLKILSKTQLMQDMRRKKNEEEKEGDEKANQISPVLPQHGDVFINNGRTQPVEHQSNVMPHQPVKEQSKAISHTPFKQQSNGTPRQPVKEQSDVVMPNTPSVSFSQATPTTIENKPEEITREIRERYQTKYIIRKPYVDIQHSPKCLIDRGECTCKPDIYYPSDRQEQDSLTIIRKDGYIKLQR